MVENAPLKLDPQLVPYREFARNPYLILNPEMDEIDLASLHSDRVRSIELEECAEWPVFDVAHHVATVYGSSHIIPDKRFVDWLTSPSNFGGFDDVGHQLWHFAFGSLIHHHISRRWMVSSVIRFSESDRLNSGLHDLHSVWNPFDRVLLISRSEE